jgi:NADPH-dependent curcumin reductase CurA
MTFTNKQIIYAKSPVDGIIPDLTPNGNGTFSLKVTNLNQQEETPNDKLLVRVHYLSLDPAMRQWLTVGSALKGQYRAGDWVIAGSGWQEYALLGAKEAEKIQLPEGGRPTDAMAALGMTGLTAYFGMIEVAQVKAGDTVVVSGAAGATGLVAGQIAKIKGAKRVVGLAGSQEKCDFLVKEVGFDVAINYKDENWRRQLKAAVPEYIDVFFDNTGGDILDECLKLAAKNARFAICGAISQYNTTKPKGPANYLMIIVSSCFPRILGCLFLLMSISVEIEPESDDERLHRFRLCRAIRNSSPRPVTVANGG